jgi:nucleoside-diphosphate-sugar epimerase
MAASSSLKERVFITGANGFIGSNLCRWLLDKGYEVHGLVRPTSDLHFLEGLPVKLTYGDLRDPASFDLAGELDYIVHAASVVSDQASEPECEAGIYGTTVNLVQKVLDKEVRPKRFVYISTTLVLGYRGTNLSEENPGRPTDFMPYARAKKKAEAYLREITKSAGLPLVILRPGDTYGPYDRTTCARIIRGIERGIPVIVGHGRHRFASCYVDNLCQAVELTFRNERSVGQAYAVTNGVLPTWREFFIGLQRGVGKRQRLYVPVVVGKILAACDQLWRKLRPGYYAELSQYRIRRVTTETTYDISRTIAELGYHPDDDTQKQIRAIVDWYLEERRKGHIQ